MKLSKNILVADDEAKITEVIAAFLKKCGYNVFVAADGQAVMDIFERENIALIVLDLMLPDISGEEICRRIRLKSRVPVIMLTAKTAKDDLVNALNLGADDYMTKPFSLNELHARIEAVLRRSLYYSLAAGLWDSGDLFIDIEKNIVKKKGRAVTLTANEFKLMAVFIKYPGRVFSRAELIDFAFDDCFDGYDRTVDSHIKNLRAKLEDEPKKPRYILTVHRSGYKFEG